MATRGRQWPKFSPIKKPPKGLCEVRHAKLSYGQVALVTIPFVMALTVQEVPLTVTADPGQFVPFDRQTLIPLSVRLPVLFAAAGVVLSPPRPVSKILAALLLIVAILPVVAPPTVL
jgi:hypothetical protein